MMGVADTLLTALSGSLHPAVPAEHPVTSPDFVVKYEQKDITADIAPYLVSFSYTDYLGGQSDELQLDFEDTDGRWLRTWYPEQGDTVSLSCGDQFTGQVSWGNFEIAEIEWQRSVRGGDTVSLKALSTGITKSNRTLKAKAYENTTLAAIVRLVAKRLHLSVSGTVADIPIRRVTQYQERDVEFLTRLAAEYGHTFKIVGNTLVFESREALAGRDAAAVLLPENLTQNRRRVFIVAGLGELPPLEFMADARPVGDVSGESQTCPQDCFHTQLAGFPSGTCIDLSCSNVVAVAGARHQMVERQRASADFGLCRGLAAADLAEARAAGNAVVPQVARWIADKLIQAF